MPAEDKGKKGGKKRKQAAEDGGGEEKSKRGEEGAQEQFTVHLDAESVEYLRQIGERLSEGLEDDEEREIFVENILAEMWGKMLAVATDRTGSVILQQLLPLCSLEQVGQLMEELNGHFQMVSCDRCGGHVMENALRQTSRWTEEEECTSVLEAQVLSLGQVVRDNTKHFIGDAHGSHVVCTLLHVLAGCLGPPRTDARPGHDVAPQLTDFEIPTSFWYEMKRLGEALMNNIHRNIADASVSVVFQTMLLVCHRKRPKLCKQLLKGIVHYLTSGSVSPGVSPLLVFLKNQASSRLMEMVIQLSHKSLLRDLYNNHLQSRLVTLALDPIANFPVQRLTAASAQTKLFPQLFDELVQGVEAILAAGHMGVIVQLAKSCVASGEKQDAMMQCLLRAFHCAEPSSRHVNCLPLFMSLLTYEVYYRSDAAEGSERTEVPLTSICYHGSLLVQALAKFKQRSLLVSSLRTLSPDDLLTLASNPAGSHVLQALITSSSDKGRGKILKRLEGRLAEMACSRLGSRVLEGVWSSASFSQRQSIAQELAPSESQLRSDQFARHVWAKFGLSHFVYRRARWQKLQTGKSAKRKLFSDILEG